MDILKISGPDPARLRELADRLERILPKVAQDMASVDALQESIAEFKDIAEQADEAMRNIAPLAAAVLSQMMDLPTPGCECPRCTRIREELDRPEPGQRLDS